MAPRKSSRLSHKRKCEKAREVKKAKKSRNEPNNGKQELAADQILEADTAVDAFLNQIGASNKKYKQGSNILSSVIPDMEESLGNTVENETISDELLDPEVLEAILSCDLNLPDSDQVQNADCANMLDKDLAGESGTPPNTVHKSVFNILNDI